ncbi:peptidase C14, caspase catalytic subunit p20 [Rhodopseudomonas palustris HaA2]|uniref:Peptidase C14, caspase catalytic subunit p20 n=1 Tax=Rhodopseudomonas palustris (strain HaA2) TaxID=316058 RepID=Q2J1Q2_RHOP2|nr:caspase family protein [Rhodopseudomonas palustris]ABD05608.1 peptidase C14, caspase catalytic subunit p20 [Rhodopseudomonas palustris HaA2]
MKIRIALLVLLTLLTAPATRSNAADDRGGRVALVIGNAKYPDSEKPLKQPVNDARELADELKRDGFDVDVGENLGGDAMRRAFDRLYNRVKPGSVALVFFSGFGIQSGRQSYMIPVDAQIWTEPDVRRDGIGLETVLGELNSRGATVKIALIDASRRNPFERRFRSFSAGLAPIIAPGGSLVMYSAALSSVVSDNGGDRSLFVSELLKEIRVPGLGAEEALNRTRVGVTRASRSEQVPWISSSLAEDFAFVPAAATAASDSAPKPAATAAPATSPIVDRTPPEAPAAPKPVEAKPAEIKPAETKPAPTPPVAAAEPKPAPLPAAAPDKPAELAKQIELPKPIDVPKELPKELSKELGTKVEPADPKQNDDKIRLALRDDPTVQSLNKRIDDNPADANALYRRGQVYASKGAYWSAIKDFDEALRLNPRDVEAYNNRCWVRTVVDELTAALKDCNEALRLRPNFVDALDSRGLLNLKNGQNKNAIADFDAALKINPRLTSSLYGRGLARQRAGMKSEGEIDITTAKGMDPNIVKEFDSYGVR